MANSYFRQFAIDNGLTVDYGYMYGKYRNFYISLKETLGSTKILTIITDICKNVEDLKKVLAVFSEEELPRYCITGMKREEKYLQFTFELNNDKSSLIVEFLNKFIDSYNENGFEPEILCPICGEKIKPEDETVVVDVAGILSPMHSTCYENKMKEREEKQKEKKARKQVKESLAGYGKGILGTIIFSLIYIAILIVAFFFVQFILNNTSSDGEYSNFATIFQYFPVLIALFACPLIYKGYDVFKGKQGTQKYIIILWGVIISTLLGTFFGFVASLLIITKDLSFVRILSLVLELIKGSYPQFRWGFYVYIVVALGFSFLSMLFKFSGKDEMAEANSETFEKLD